MNDTIRKGKTMELPKTKLEVDKLIEDAKKVSDALHPLLVSEYGDLTLELIVTYSEYIRLLEKLRKKLP